jgi:hypothetical protein
MVLLASDGESLMIRVYYCRHLGVSMVGSSVRLIRLTNHFVGPSSK